MLYVVAWGALATKVGAVRRKEMHRERSIENIVSRFFGEI